MRLKAEIEISNRTLTIHNRSGRNKKDTHASLAIGRKPQGATQTASHENMSQNGPNLLDFNLFLMVSTAQNRSGTKYAITFDKSKGNSKSNGLNVEKVGIEIFNQTLYVERIFFTMQNEHKCRQKDN